jgi:hypothetical protein
MIDRYAYVCAFFVFFFELTIHSFCCRLSSVSPLPLPLPLPSPSSLSLSLFPLSLSLSLSLSSLPSSLFPLPSSLFPLPSSLFPLPSPLFPLPSQPNQPFLIFFPSNLHIFCLFSNLQQFSSSTYLPTIFHNVVPCRHDASQCCYPPSCTPGCSSSLHDCACYVFV